MENIKKEYDEIVNERSKVLEEIYKLENEDEAVKRYSILRKQNEILEEKQHILYKDMKMAEYSSCKHILVYSTIERDSYEGRTYRYNGCIKCGLNERYANKILVDFPSFSDARIMNDYFRKDDSPLYIRGIHTKVGCDLELAKAIYAKIKENYPDIDDETAKKYFKNALNDIGNIEVSEERKVSRAKRLSLNPNFKRWNS